MSTHHMSSCTSQRSPFNLHSWHAKHVDGSSPTSGVPALTASRDPSTQAWPSQLVDGHSPLCKALRDQQRTFQKRLRVVVFVIISLNTLQIQNTTCFVFPLPNKLPQFQIWLDLTQLLPIPVIGVPSPCTNIGMNLVIQSGCCIIHVQPGLSEFNFGMTHICTEMCVCKVGCAWKVTSLCAHI